VLFAERGTEVRISPLLEGIRTLSGEKIGSAIGGAKRGAEGGVGKYSRHQRGVDRPGRYRPVPQCCPQGIRGVHKDRPKGSLGKRDLIQKDARYAKRMILPRGSQIAFGGLILDWTFLQGYAKNPISNFVFSNNLLQTDSLRNPLNSSDSSS
jgi:hypothetical protein